MPLFAMRVWLPDRPGALGAVASRVGAVRGDVVGIEIIERGAGRAVDELTVDLPDADLVDLLVNEVHEIDGVDVEDVRALGHLHEDLAVSALEVAGAVATADTPAAAASAIVHGAIRLLHADWAALVDLAAEALVDGAGEDLPNAGWLCAFARGATAGGTEADLEQFAFAVVPEHRWTLVVFRDHLPLRGRERALLDGLGVLG
jgi:hypothetical protein